MTTTTTAGNGTAAATRPAVPRCANCSRIDDISGRGLCRVCYADGATRSQFNSAGQRVAAPPVTRPLDDDTPFAGQTARSSRLAGHVSYSDAAPADEDTRRRREDAALIDAAERLTAAGNHVCIDDGLPAAGQLAAGRLAGLNEHRAGAVAERLVKAGRLRRVEVRTRNGEGRLPGGRPARGLRLVTAGAATGQ